MKSFLVGISFIFTLTTYAEVKKEFDETLEKKCFAEAKALGCVKADRESSACLAINKTKMHPDCQSLREVREKN